MIVLKFTLFRLYIINMRGGENMIVWDEDYWWTYDSTSDYDEEE